MNDRQVTGILLILAFVFFATGATLPIIGKRGNFRIFTLPVQEQLAAVARNMAVWRWTNILIGAAGVILLAGLTMLTIILEEAGERTLSRLGLVGTLFAVVLWVVLWVIFSIFRAVITISAAQEMAQTGTVPAYYPPLARWGFGLFYVYALVGFLALASYGGAFLSSGLFPAWAGWGTVIFSIAMLGILLVTGDNLPAFHYLPPLVVGILLLL